MVIYKIMHIPTGKFVAVKLKKEGINVWREKDVLSGNNPNFGNVLRNSHPGWKTPPEPSDYDFSTIDCRIVEYHYVIEER